MEITLLQSAAELASRREAWNDVLQRSAAANVFLTHEWISAWTEVFGDDRRPAVVWVEERGTPIGFAPLYVETRGYAAGVRATQLFVLGNAEVGGDFLDFVIVSGREKEVLAATIGFLKKELSWDRLLLDDADTASVSVTLLGSLAPAHGLSMFVRARNRCPSMELPETWDAFMEMPDKIFKRIVQREGVKKLWKRHTVELVLSCPPQDLDAGLTTLFDLSLQRRRAQGVVCCFENPKVIEFYRTVSPRLAQNNWLRLSLLRIDGTVRAAEYGMQYGSCYYSLQGGCDAEGLKVRAGHVLQYKIMESLVGKVRTYHFLRGEEQYKYQWGCSDRHTAQIALARTPKGWLFSGARVTRDRAKRAAKAMLKKARGER